MKIDLTGNVKTFGRIFVTASKNPQYGHRLVQRLVTLETEKPWRRGRGWGILVLPGVVAGIGTWEPDPAPNMEPEAREAMEHASQIPRWTRIGTLHEDRAEEGARGLPDGWTFIPAGAHGQAPAQGEGDADGRSVRLG